MVQYSPPTSTATRSSIRESLAPDAKQVDAMVTPGKGLVMQYRTDTGGPSATLSQRTGAAPTFIRIFASPNFEGQIVFVQADYSSDGTLWHLLGQAHVQMRP